MFSVTALTDLAFSASSAATCKFIRAQWRDSTADLDGVSEVFQEGAEAAEKNDAASEVV